MRISAKELIAAQDYARPKISNILRRFPNDIDDVLQQAAINAIEGRHGFRGDASFKTWFTTIAIRLALIHLRRFTEGGRGRTLSIDVVDIVHPLVDRQPDALAITAKSEQAQALYEEILALGPVLKQEAYYYLAEVDCGKNNVRKARRFRMRYVLRERLLQRGFFASC